MSQLYLVTGAAGHLGSTVVRTLLRSGKAVRGLILPAETPAVSGAEYVRGDVRQPETLAPLFRRSEGQELVVLHTAGLVDITGAERPELWAVNVEGTQTMLALSREHAVKRFVYVSSVHAIPEPADGGLVTEIDRFAPERVTGGYAKTKAAATRAVLEAARAGLPAVVVHPSGILGPYDPGRNHLVQMLLDFLEGRLPACVRGGYDVVDVRDVAEGCILAAERGRPGQCYILSGAYAELSQLLGLAGELCGKRCPPVLPMPLARAGEPLLRRWAQAHGQRPLYTKYSLDTVCSGVRFSSAKARAELGYLVRTTKATVRDTVQWLLEHPQPEEVIPWELSAPI